MRSQEVADDEMAVLLVAPRQADVQVERPRALVGAGEVVVVGHARVEREEVAEALQWLDVGLHRLGRGPGDLGGGDRAWGGAREGGGGRGVLGGGGGRPR